MPGREREAVLLGDLISVLAPYDEKEASVRIRVSVPKMNVGENSSTTLALVIHELATNSAKYGSLSVASGTLDVSCNGRDDQVVIMWTERGGPAISARHARRLRQQTDTQEYGRATRWLYRL
jgi:two-component sensor histidine kinase